MSAVTLARIQMSVIYFQSCLAKLPRAEWADWRRKPRTTHPGPAVPDGP
ncbi:hypothetical protein ACM614_29510 [Streptomyces sp. 12297]